MNGTVGLFEARRADLPSERVHSEYKRYTLMYNVI